MATEDETATPSPTAVGVSRLPVIAIVGRPNAGKSTLFNRLVGGQRAVVHATPGVTRDCNEAAAEWEGQRFLLVDTGGFDEGALDADGMIDSVRAQTLQASAAADAVIVLLDGRTGFSIFERDLVHRLRASRSAIFFAVNKLDTPSLDGDAVDFFRLAVDRVYPISAAHGRGVEDLMTDVLAALPRDRCGPAPETEEPVALAIVGRPNAGKSSLLNRLVGFERAIVAAAPGTTRDAVDSLVVLGGRRYRLIDTAGIRRRSRVHQGIERACVTRALRALDRAELAILLLDGTTEMAEQDARIAGYAWDRGRAVLLVVNKWDAVADPDRSEQEFRSRLAWAYPTLADLPLVFLSALTGLGVEKIVPVLRRLAAAHRKHLQTARVNQVLMQAVRAQAPASVRGKRPVFYYATQTDVAPPRLTLFSSAPWLVQASYERYLRNQFVAAFDLRGTPLQLHFRARAGGKRPRMRQPGTGSKNRQPARRRSRS